jgi:hypothetical protein
MAQRGALDYRKRRSVEKIAQQHAPVPISRIREIAALDDPPWLVDSNKAGTLDAPKGGH